MLTLTIVGINCPPEVTGIAPYTGAPAQRASALWIAFLGEYLDDTVKSSEDLNELLELPTLGAERCD